MRQLSLLFVLTFTLNAFASDKISQTILQEYKTLRDHVSTLKHDYMLGGLYKAKRFDGYELFWKLGKGGVDGDTIRFYRDAEKYGDGFGIDYITGTHIVRGQNIVRRFIGLERSGWRNHTVDLEDGYYYGSQGASTPRMTAFDREILKKWKITVFPGY